MSALIFVALAVAWAVYLVPKALRHHDDVVRSRSVDRFSHTMRVLARREPVSRRSARLVVTPGRPASTAIVVTKGEPTSARPTPVTAPVAEATAPGLAPRSPAAVAAKRRLRVLVTLLVVTLAVVGAAAFGLIGWAYVAAPVGLIVAWLVACRLMVKRERSVRVPSSRVDTPVTETVTPTEQPIEDQHTDQIARVDAEVAPEEVEVDEATVAAATIDPTLWNPVPVTLPTYVTKPVAPRRTVRTIALDDTGVWTSGRSESDSQIARDAERADKSARARKNDGDDTRAVGS